MDPFCDEAAFRVDQGRWWTTTTGTSNRERIYGGEGTQPDDVGMLVPVLKQDSEEPACGCPREARSTGGDDSCRRDLLL